MKTNYPKVENILKYLQNYALDMNIGQNRGGQSGGQIINRLIMR